MKSAVTAIILVFTTNLCFADTPAAEVKATIAENLRATQAEDIDAVMKTMHSESPGRVATRARLPELFERYDLKYELVKYEFVSVSGEYAIARVLQRTTKVEGPAFRDNLVDSLIICKQDDGKWTLWTQSLLEVKYE